MNNEKAAKAAGVAKSTMSVCFQRCREVCTKTESVPPKIVGTEAEPVQVDYVPATGDLLAKEKRRRKCELKWILAALQPQAKMREMNLLGALLGAPTTGPG